MIVREQHRHPAGVIDRARRQAEDALLARKIFEEIGSRPHAEAWRSKDDFLRFRNWAYGEP